MHGRGTHILIEAINEIDQIKVLRFSKLFIKIPVNPVIEGNVSLDIENCLTCLRTVLFFILQAIPTK